MHRRAHGGAWVAAVLLSGCCSGATAAEPGPAPGYSSTAPTYGSSSFTPASVAPSTGPTSGSGPSTAAVEEPVANSNASAAAIGILPTPFVPSASILSQRDRTLSPPTVVNLPAKQTMLSPSTSETTIGSATAVLKSQAISAGPLVPVILPAAEREMLENALRRALGSATDVAKARAPDDVDQTSAAATASDGKAKTPAPISKTEPVASPAVQPNTSAYSQNDAGATNSRAASGKLPKTTKTSSGDVAGDDYDIAEVETASAKKPAPIVKEIAATSAGMITPLPPVGNEAPSRASLPLNLPQTPIPLAYPRTGH